MTRNRSKLHTAIAFWYETLASSVIIVSKIREKKTNKYKIHNWWRWKKNGSKLQNYLKIKIK